MIKEFFRSLCAPFFAAQQQPVTSDESNVRFMDSLPPDLQFQCVFCYLGHLPGGEAVIIAEMHGEEPQNFWERGIPNQFEGYPICFEWGHEAVFTHL